MRYFTPQTANQMLPLVQRIADDLVRLQFDVNIRGDRVNELAKKRRGLDSTEAHDEELAEMKSSLQLDRDRMVEIQEELASLGIIIHCPKTGILDFPAKLDSQDVRLCWRPGEASITQYHFPGDPPEARIPIEDLQFDPVLNDDPDNGNASDSYRSMHS